MEGTSSPLIDEIQLQNPATGTQTCVDIGTWQEFSGSTRISGTEWLASKHIDGHTVRGFQNGYPKHNKAVSGGPRHNIYFIGMLPEQKFAGYFDVPDHKLVLRYKDVAAGRFAVKAQVIHDGNQLKFVPLRNGVLSTNGDQRWKEATFTVRPQELGWYKGPDYQRYEVEQLQQIANQTKDWFFRQYAERHRHFLEAQQNGEDTIIEPVNSNLLLRKDLSSGLLMSKNILAWQPKN